MRDFTEIGSDRDGFTVASARDSEDWRNSPQTTEASLAAQRRALTRYVEWLKSGKPILSGPPLT
jgi:hypothetical protein